MVPPLSLEARICGRHPHCIPGQGLGSPTQPTVPWPLGSVGAASGMWRSLVSAPALGAGGRRFESGHPDYRTACGRRIGLGRGTLGQNALREPGRNRRRRHWDKGRRQGRRDRPPHLGLGAVPHDPGQLGHERLHRHGGQGRGHDRHRDPAGHHALHAGDGCIHDHGREAGPDLGTQTGLHDRVHRLRLRVVHDGDRPHPHGSHHRLVTARRPGRCADHARRGGAGGHQLREGRAAPRLRPRRVCGCHRRGGRPVGRRPLHHLRQLALGLRRRGRPRGGHPGAVSAHGRLAGRAGRAARSDGHPPLGGRARPDRLRRDPLGLVGRGPTQTRRPGLAGALPRCLARARRRLHPGRLRGVGEPPDRPRGAGAGRPEDAAGAASSSWADVLLLPVPPPGGDVLRHPPLPLRGPRALRRGHRACGCSPCQ